MDNHSKPQPSDHEPAQLKPAPLAATGSDFEAEPLANLNDAQRRAVSHFKGPILVLAGAGSGKTRVLTRRIAYLILHHNVRPQNILAVTFTNKATEEMRGRLSSMLGSRADELWVATFHSAALKMLRRHATELNYSRDFVVYDEQDSKSVMKGVLKECSIDEKRFPPQGFLRAIDRAKNAVILPEDYYRWASGKGASWVAEDAPRGNSKSEAFEYQLKLQAEVYGFYQKALMRANSMDFGDLLMNAVLLLEGSPDVLKFYQHHLQFVLVDEFQDTNEAQYRFIKLLTKTHHNLLVVGDDDQSIYAFRGATIRNILEFEKDFPETEIVTLDQNYRSTGNILDAAFHVIQHNPERKEKRLWTDAPAGSPVKLFVGSDEMEEAQFVVEQVATHAADGLPLDQMAVFYRTNAQSRVLEEAFVSAGLPYRIFGGLKFYDRKEVKDILAYLRLIVNESDDQALLRVINTPPRGIGQQAIESIQRHSQQQKVPLLQSAREVAKSNKKIEKFVELFDVLKKRSAEIFLSRLIHEIVEGTGYAAKLKELHDATGESRLENLLELEAIGRAAEQAGQTPSESLRLFLDRVALTASADTPGDDAQEKDPQAKDKRPPAVSFMTLHLAKGLEFPLVFLTGCEEGLLPHHRALFDPRELEEERRLCYVGITRAMKEIYITRALTRGMFASGDSFGGLYRDPSRFLSDIPVAITEQCGLAQPFVIDEDGQISRDEAVDDDVWDES